MSTEPTPEEIRAIADSISGTTRRDAYEEIIARHAAQTPEADEERSLPPAGNAEELDELRPGASNDETFGMGRGPGYDDGGTP